MNAIQIENLTQRFGSFTAVDDLQLTIARGEVFGLLGPNGSGKTTTLNMINGLSRPTGGRVLVHGTDPAREPVKVRMLLGMVPQETALYDDLTAQENLAFHAGFYGVPAQERQGRIEAALDLVELAGRRHDRVGAYSGGMRRRLALARALLTDPRVLILDEPTLGVDVQARASIWSHIRQMKEQGRTVLVTTNVMEEADALCDRLAIIDRGRLVALGSPAELKRQVGGELIELSGEIDPRTLEGLDGLQATVPHAGGLRLTVQNAAALLPRVLGHLAARGITVAGVTMRQPSLNDVFLHLTGRKLRD